MDFYLDITSKIKGYSQLNKEFVEAIVDEDILNILSGNSYELKMFQKSRIESALNRKLEDCYNFELGSLIAVPCLQSSSGFYQTNSIICFYIKTQDEEFYSYLKYIF